ncbi:MAG TPA: sugar transferase [Pyrinomonadaceae bacterium]|nr:sugar transferase [Pyrinomonadaceae bacterium]
MRAERKREQLTEARAVRVPGRAPRWIIPTVKALLVITDALVAAGSFTLAFSFREGVSAFGVSGSVWSRGFAPYAALLPLVVIIRLLSFRYCDLYRLRGEFSLVDDSIRTFKATAIGSLLIVAAAFLYRGGFEFRAFSYARGVFVVDFFLVLVSVIAVRFIMRSAQTLVRRRQINLIPTLVVGRGPEAALFIREMRERPALGYRVIGVVDTKVSDQVGSYEGVPVIASLEGLPEAIRDSAANEVIIADPQVSGDALFEVMMRCGRRRGVEFRIAPSLFNCLPRKTEIDQIGVLPMIRLFREPLSSGARLLKRTFDVVVCASAIVLLFPLWLLLALLIKFDSKGPVLYKQERVGMDGRLFLLYKFRTMIADADPEMHREYQRSFIAGRAEANLGNAQKPTYKLLADPRITRVGTFLRRTSLDEVPQLLNVLLGDMSIVGPRPPIPYEVEAYELWHRKRLDMKPGVTGLWQVSGRNRLPFEEMVRLDLFYIENWSLLLDLKIILRTGFVIIGREGY